MNGGRRSDHSAAANTHGLAPDDDERADPVEQVAGESMDAPGWVGTAEHFRWLEGFVKAILIMNVLDAILTIYWISAERAVEANPLLAELAHSHPLAFVAVKLSLVSLGSGLLWRLRQNPLAVIGIFAGFLGYYFLLIYHLEALNPQLFSRIFGL